MNIPPKDKWGNPKTINPFRKVSGRNRCFPKTMRLWKRLGMHKKWEGVLDGIKQGLEQVRQHERGEIELKTYDEFLNSSELSPK